MTRITTATLLALALSSCKEPVVEEDTATAPVADKARCQEMLDEIREIRGGKQACKTSDECTVWHNGEFWDGCPPEVTRTNAKKLDTLRDEFEKAGCAANKKGYCSPKVLRGCVLGACGRAKPILKLSPEDRKRWMEQEKEPAAGGEGTLK